MYIYTKSFVKEKSFKALWEEKNISSETMYALHTNYQNVILVLTSPFHTGEKSISVADLPISLKSKSNTETLLEFLVRIDNYGLPFDDWTPNLEIKFAEYKDGFLAGFDIELTNPEQHHTTNTRKADQTALRVTKEGFEPKEIYDTCLFTVNGLLHRSNYVTDAVNVIDGGRSNQLLNRNTLGVYQLGSLGKITQVPISRAHVTSNGSGQPLGEVAYLKLDEELGDLTGKTVLLSLAGYLQIPDVSESIYRVSDRVIKVDFKDYPLPNKLFDLKKRVDTERITRRLSKSTVNSEMVSISELFSDDVIKDFCSMSQSFFIVVDTPTIIVEKEAVEFNQLPGKYITSTLPKYPLITSEGVMSEYCYRKEYDRYVISMTDHLAPNYLFETTGWRKLNAVDDSKVPNNLYDYARVKFLKLGKQG